MTNPFSFGSDPEFILQNKTGRIASAIDVLKASIKNKISDGEFDFFYDNVLAECRLPPANSKAEAVDTIGNALIKLNGLIKPYRLSSYVAKHYPTETLNHPDAFKINCHPEICAYTNDTIELDENFFKTTCLRSAGGHIHLGSPICLQEPMGVVRMLDLFLGIPSLFLDKNEDTKVRRQVYGKAGRYRNTSYGIEYRSLSNFWLTSPKLIELVYDICDFVLQFVENGRYQELWTTDVDRLDDPKTWLDPNFRMWHCYICHSYDASELRSAINDTNQKLGRKFMDYIASLMPLELIERITDQIAQDELDIYKEWSLQ